MHENPKLTIAIDGPSGSGKSSVSKEVARHFGLAYLDTGAMYRAATYRVLELGIDLNDAEAIAKAVKEMPWCSARTSSEEEIMMGSPISVRRFVASAFLRPCLPWLRFRRFASTSSVCSVGRLTTP